MKTVRESDGTWTVNGLDEQQVHELTGRRPPGGMRTFRSSDCMRDATLQGSHLTLSDATGGSVSTTDAVYPPSLACTWVGGETRGVELFANGTLHYRGEYFGVIDTNGELFSGVWGGGQIDSPKDLVDWFNDRGFYPSHSECEEVLLGRVVPPKERKEVFE